MFDFMRERGRTAEDKQQEALNAYLDNALTPAERETFERRLAQDAGLRAELEQLRALKLQLRSMPRRRVPRSFALDPAVYGRPKSQPLLQLYPVLRGATAITAVLLIFTLALGAFGNQFGVTPTAAPAADVALFESAQVEEAPAAEMVGAEAASGAAPEAPPAADERAAATSAPAAEMAQESAPGAAAEEAGGDFALQQAVPELEGTPEALATVEVSETMGVTTVEAYPLEPTVTPESIAAAGEAADNGAAADVGAVVETSPAQAAPSARPWLTPLQIILAVVFVVLLILWLIGRRRMRSL